MMKYRKRLPELQLADFRKAVHDRAVGERHLAFEIFAVTHPERSLRVVGSFVLAAVNHERLDLFAVKRVGGDDGIDHRLFFIMAVLVTGYCLRHFTSPGTLSTPA